MQNYDAGDKVCMFGLYSVYLPSTLRADVTPGFSRGAYTARALAGMVHKVREHLPTVDLSLTCRQVGLLSKDNEQLVSFAYKLYASDTSDDSLASGFKLTFCREVPIEFMGVWYVVPHLLE